MGLGISQFSGKVSPVERDAANATNRLWLRCGTVQCAGLARLQKRRDSTVREQHHGGWEGTSRRGGGDTVIEVSGRSRGGRGE